MGELSPSLSIKEERNHHAVLMDFMKDKKIETMGEIGAWKCQMTDKILSAYPKIKNYWATDIWGWNDANPGYPTMSERWWDDIYCKNCNLMLQYKQLRIIRGSATQIYKIFPKNYFDLVYIDADHRYEFMFPVIQKWLPLIKSGGFLMGKAYAKRHGGLIEAVDEYFGEEKTIIENSTVWYHIKNG